MRNLIFFLPTILVCLVFAFAGCKKENQQANDQKELEQMYTEIKSMAEKSNCGGEQQLKYIAVGVKACGGPASYIAYSTSIDINTFERLVAQYNQRQLNYNQTWGVISDCALVVAPKAVTCENGKPILVN